MTIAANKKPKGLASLKILLALAVIINVLFWFDSRNLQATWTNVPPVPSKISAVFPTIGDTQFASRILATIIQNFGNTGGRVTAIKEYNFENLGDWLNLHYELDQNSDIMPYMAAYYFGASQEPKKIRPIIEYLRKAGNNSNDEKWRWLVQGIYLARFKLNDMKLALEMADELAELDNDEMPAWARRMRVNILNQSGEKEAALELMLAILADKADKLHPNEVNAMVGYICEQILDPQETRTHDLCKDLQ